MAKQVTRATLSGLIAEALQFGNTRQRKRARDWLKWNQIDLQDFGGDCYFLEDKFTLPQLQDALAFIGYAKELSK